MYRVGDGNIMAMCSRHACLFLVAFSFAACDKKSASTAGDFCRSFQNAVNARLLRCYGGTQAYWGAFSTRYIRCDDSSAAVASGQLRYDPASGESCVQFITNADCFLPSNYPSVCDKVLTPTKTLPVGAVCKLSASAGDPFCEEGLVCQSTVSGCTGTCEGGRQDASAEGQSCQDSWSCADNLYCDTSSAGVGVCRKQKISGACRDDWTCAAGYVCAGPKDQKTCALAKKTGESCRPGEGECYRAWNCGSDGKCALPATENEPCNRSLSSEAIDCDLDLYCDQGAGRCRKQKAPGSSCSSYGECAGLFAFCDSAGECVACQ